MLINGKHYRTIFESPDNSDIVNIIDQRLLPFKFEIIQLKEFNDYIFAIREMLVRGAPLIGITAAYAVYSAAKSVCNDSDFYEKLLSKSKEIINTRPTAVNLEWAVKKQLNAITGIETTDEILDVLLSNARKMTECDAEQNRRIGKTGFELINDAYNNKKNVLNILTHCNAGWLATVDYGTALAPIYEAQKEGIPIHVWVDETRPRNQGAKLTAFELYHQQIPHTIIADNAGGLLMQQGKVDLCIVGADRMALNGDAANKIGTYLKALAAKDNDIPFYFALPVSTIDRLSESGSQIIIEERSSDEIRYAEKFENGTIEKFPLVNLQSEVSNPGFDITPARLITKIITDRGLINPSRDEIMAILE